MPAKREACKASAPLHDHQRQNHNGGHRTDYAVNFNRPLRITAQMLLYLHSS